jgi:hydroxyacyl-ACP dehydratase HTD2-like protein with hotdog domain
MKPPSVNSVLRHVCSSRISDIAALEPVAKLETSLYESLTSRKTKTQWDSLDLTVANHLTKTLEKYLQKTILLSKLPSRFNAAIPKLHLPPGYHQVYFNPAYEEGHLLSDGTDRAHSPGWPFEKRLWGGGSLIFNHEGKWMMKNGYLGILQEDIENVQVKGKEGEEKIFVTVSRKAAMGVALGIRRNLATQRWPPDLRTLEGTNLKEGKLGRLALEEKKTLVFMRTKTDEELRQSLEAEPRIIKGKFVSSDLDLSDTIMQRHTNPTLNKPLLQQHISCFDFRPSHSTPTAYIWTDNTLEK